MKLVLGSTVIISTTRKLNHAAAQCTRSNQSARSTSNHNDSDDNDMMTGMATTIANR